MFVAPVDAGIISTDEMDELLARYEEKFGERFIAFNYADFQRIGEKCAAQVYKETIEAALESGKPYHIVSRRYSQFDH